MKNLSHEKTPIKTLQALSSLYMCYETDLCLYIKTIGKSSNTYSKVLNTLVKRNYIVRSNLFNKKVVAITKKGTIALSDLFPHVDYFSLVEKAKNNFPSLSDSSKVIPRLEENSLALLFKDFTFNKPDLFYLYTHLENQEDYIKNKFSPALLENSLYNNSLENFSGHFYSRKEFFEFNKILNPTNPEINDLYYSSRFRGVYISPRHLLVIYHASAYPTGVLKVLSDVEESLCQHITDLFSYALSLNTKADCLLIGRSPSYAYNLLIGKHGHHIEQENAKPRVINIKKNQGYLTLSSGIFNRYYVIANNLKSKNELDYLLSHSPKEYLEDVENYFNSCEGFSKASEGYYYDDDTNSFAFYLPFIELSMLDTIYKNYNTPTVITSSNLAESIAHCLRKPCNIYDYDLSPLEVSTYTNSGYKENEVVPLKTRKPPTAHRSITLTNTEDFYSDLKRLAKLNNTSMNSLAKKILSPIVKELLQNKEQELEMLKSTKKN